MQCRLTNVDPLLRNEQFAISLRKAKKSQLLNERRERIREKMGSSEH
jgi:hypothetical protein